MRELKAAFRRIEESGEGDFTGPIPEDLVAEAETLLGLRFPPTYRTFLKQLGCGDIAGAEFYGIADENLTRGPIPNGIWLTLEERNTSGLPPEMILVGFTGTGPYYAIDLSRASGEEGEAPVVMWQPGTSGLDLPVVAQDFGLFVLQEINDALGEDDE